VRFIQAKDRDNRISLANIPLAMKREIHNVDVAELFLYAVPGIIVPVHGQGDFYDEEPRQTEV
jgi:hypothetical protein